MNLEQQKQWCIDKHRETNHYYDTYLPYEFHLRMVSKVAEDFINLIPDSNDGKTTLRNNIILSAYGHDLVEDTRVSFNDCKEKLGLFVANVIYAVSNEKGKNRAERANDKYYQGIRETEGASFVKICDRIANVQYSKMTGSKMYQMYEKENKHFINSVLKPELRSSYLPILNYLASLFSSVVV
jgi:(p)ppGpp synthase/HD superfamily hydrolase